MTCLSPSRCIVASRSMTSGVMFLEGMGRGGKYDYDSASASCVEECNACVVTISQTFMLTRVIGSSRCLAQRPWSMASLNWWGSTTSTLINFLRFELGIFWCPYMIWRSRVMYTPRVAGSLLVSVLVPGFTVHVVQDLPVPSLASRLSPKRATPAHTRRGTTVVFFERDI